MLSSCLYFHYCDGNVDLSCSPVSTTFASVPCQSQKKPLNFAQTYWHILLQCLRHCNDLHRNNTADVDHNNLIQSVYSEQHYWRNNKLLSTPHESFCFILDKFRPFKDIKVGKKNMNHEERNMFGKQIFSSNIQPLSLVTSWPSLNLNISSQLMWLFGHFFI